MKKRIFCLLLAVVMCVALLPATALAVETEEEIVLAEVPEEGLPEEISEEETPAEPEEEEVPAEAPTEEILPEENVTEAVTLEEEMPVLEAQTPVTYLDAYGVEQTCTEYFPVTIFTASFTQESFNGWYVVSGNIDSMVPIRVIGDVHLILMDNCALRVLLGGISIVDDGSLTIYAQSAGANMGTLETQGAINRAGIGNDSSSRVSDFNITINGGNVICRGGFGAAGIGMGNGSSRAHITINGGSVTATGGLYGAGIGNGVSVTGDTTVAINGGTVVATGGQMGSGIGAGAYGSSCGSVTVTNGDVTATGGTGSYGIDAASCTVKKPTVGWCRTVVETEQGAVTGSPILAEADATSLIAQSTAVHIYPENCIVAINGEFFTPNKLTIPCGSGEARLDPTTPVMTLILDNAELVATEACCEIDNKMSINHGAIYNDCEDLVIELSGTNSITWPGERRKYIAGILSNGNITLTGSGDLTITTDFIGILARGNVAISGSGNFAVTNGTDGIYCYDDNESISIGGSRNVSIHVDEQALFASRLITVSDSASLTTYGGYHGIFCVGGIIISTSGDVDASSYACAIGGSFLRISGSGNVTAVSEDLDAIFIYNSVTLSGSGAVSVTSQRGAAVRIDNGTGEQFPLMLEGTASPITLKTVTGAKAVTTGEGTPVGGSTFDYYTVEGDPHSEMVVYTLKKEALPTTGEYTIIAGANGEWTKGGAAGLAFTSDAPFAKFDSVKVDGSAIAPTNYTAEEGSTKITLAPAYLETLSVGGHTLDIVSTDGTASTGFLVKAAPTPVTYSVTFQMNGHGTQAAAQTVIAGSKATQPAAPKASGFVFEGWYADEKLSVKFDFNAPIHADTTVYAKWTAVDPKIPQTGKNTMIYAGLLFLAGSAMVLTGMALNKRKKNNT